MIEFLSSFLSLFCHHSCYPKIVIFILPKKYFSLLKFFIMRTIANYLDNFPQMRLITLPLILKLKKKEQGRGEAVKDYRVRVLP